MPLLAPDIPAPVDEKAITELLGESGAIEKADAVQTEAQVALINAGASVDELSGSLAELAQTAENEGVRLQAIKTGLEIHGVGKHREAKGAPNILINFADKDPRAMGVLNPQR